MILLRYVFGCFICLIMVACSFQKNNEKELAPLKYIDSLLLTHKDMMYNNPDSMVMMMTHYQQQVSDSLAWYYWETCIGHCHFFDNNSDLALSYYDRVTNFFRKNGISSPYMALISATNENNRAVLLQTINERDSALSCLNTIYNSLNRTNFHIELPDICVNKADICINAADVCRQLGHLSEASAWYHKALVTIDSISLYPMKHSIYLGLAQVYGDLNNFSLAQQYYHKIDSLYPPQSPYEEYMYFNSRGNCYYYDRKYVEALSCFRQAYVVVRPFRQRSMEAIVEGNMGEVFLLLEQIDSARYYIHRSHEFLANDPQSDDALRFYVNGLCASLALEENDLQTAERYLSIPYDAVRIGPAYTYLHHKRLMEYYRKKGDYKNAFIYREIVDEYDDSLRNANHLNSIAEIDYRYRQDTTLLRRDIIIANSRSEVSHLQSAVSISVALLVLLVVLVFTVFWYIRRRHERQRLRQVSLVTRLRMENVRNRFSPHFVFNVLNVIVSSLRQHQDQAMPLRLLVQVLRSNLLVSGKMAISIGEEINMVKDYVELRRSMNPQTSRVQWDIAKDVDMSLLLPSMIVQIPVENALKHAFSADMINEKEEPLIVVSICNEDVNCFKVIIEDNGKGYVKAAGNQSATSGVNDTGNGLRILYRTVELLNIQNLQKIYFEISDRALSRKEEHGTRVTIMIPHPFNFDV